MKKTVKQDFNKVWENFALDVTGISVFTDETSFELASGAFHDLSTIKNKLTGLRTDVQNSIQLNFLSGTLEGTNTTCSTTSSGSTVFGGNDLSTTPVVFKEDICTETLRDYWYANYMAESMRDPSLGSYEEFIIDQKVKVTNEILEKLIWCGTLNRTAASNSGTTTAYQTGVTTHNLSLLNTVNGGFLQHVHANSASTLAMITRSAVTVGNAVFMVDRYNLEVAGSAIGSAPLVRLYMSPSDFNLYLAGLRNEKYPVQSLGQDAKGVTEIMHPGSSNLVVTRTLGLSAAETGRWIATPPMNAYVGTNEAQGYAIFDVFPSKENRNLKIYQALRLGVQFVDYGQVVGTKN